jgi:hypothetical protein
MKLYTHRTSYMTLGGTSLSRPINFVFFRVFSGPLSLGAAQKH